MRWLWCTAVVLLSMCLPQAATAVAPLSSAGPVLEEMGKRLEDQTQPAPERLDIIKVFGEWATSQVRPPLVAVLKDPQPEIREAARSIRPGPCPGKGKGWGGATGLTRPGAGALSPRRAGRRPGPPRRRRLRELAEEG